MARERHNFTVSVLRENGVLYYGDCTALTVPSKKDSITVLPYHTPMIMRLGEGPILLQNGHDKQEVTKVKSGLLYVGENEVTVLVDL